MFKGELAESLGIGKDRILFVTIDDQGIYKMQGTMHRDVYDYLTGYNSNDTALKTIVSALTPVSNRTRETVEKYLEIIK